MLNQINEDLKEALKTSDKFKLSVLRMLKSALQAEQIEKKKELSDEEVMAVIKKQVKIRKASKEEYISYQREDLALDLDKEIQILASYLPEELSEEEIEEILAKIFTEEKPESIKDMGKIMKKASEVIGIRADMSEVSKKIKAKLTN